MEDSPDKPSSAERAALRLLARLDGVGSSQSNGSRRPSPDPAVLRALTGKVGGLAAGLEPLVDELSEKVKEVEGRGGVLALSAEEREGLLADLEGLFDELEDRMFAIGLTQGRGEDES